MKLTEVIRRYNRAWEARYAEALVNLFRKSSASSEVPGGSCLHSRNTWQ